MLKMRGEFAESKESQAELINHVNKLLERLDDKDHAVFNPTIKKNELVEKVSNATELNNHTESEIQEAQAGLLQATSAAALAESTVTSLSSVIEELRRDNESLQDQLNDSQDSISEVEHVDAVPLISTSSIGFDDVTTNTSCARIPNGYCGLSWNNVLVSHCSARPGSGYEYGPVSGNYAA